MTTRNKIEQSIYDLEKLTKYNDKTKKHRQMLLRIAGYISMLDATEQEKLILGDEILDYLNVNTSPSTIQYWRKYIKTNQQSKEQEPAITMYEHFFGEPL